MPEHMYETCMKHLIWWQICIKLICFNLGTVIWQDLSFLYWTSGECLMQLPLYSAKHSGTHTQQCIMYEQTENGCSHSNTDSTPHTSRRWHGEKSFHSEHKGNLCLQGHAITISVCWDLHRCIFSNKEKSSKLNYNLSPTQP